MKAIGIILVIAVSAALSANIRPRVYQPGPYYSFSRSLKPKIIGDEAKPHSIPYQAALKVSSGLCGGVLITSRHVLTAGHCVFMSDAPDVILGAHDLSQSEPEQKIYTAKTTIVHPDFEEDIFSDIAIVELPEEVPIDDNIKPINLANNSTGDLVGETGTSSGWGVSEPGSINPSPVLRYAENTVISNEDCTEAAGFDVPHSVVCVDASNKKGICQMDGGGPLTVNIDNTRVLAGIITFGMSPNCNTGLPNAYARISHFAEWIRENIN